MAPHCGLSLNQQQIWHHLLRMYADVRRLPPEMLSGLVQPSLPPFSSAAMLMTSSSASASSRCGGLAGSGFNLATSVCLKFHDIVMKLIISRSYCYDRLAYWHHRHHVVRPSVCLSVTLCILALGIGVHELIEL